MRIISTLILLGIAYCLNGQTNTFPSSGNVGIGTTNPLVSLHVISAAPELRITNTGTGDVNFSMSHPGQQWNLAMQTDNLFRIYNVTAGTYPLVVSTTGNVGIGTTSPSVWNGAPGIIVSQYSASGNTIYSLQSNTTSLDQGGILEGYSNAVTSGSKAVGSIAFLRENTSTTALSSYTAFYTNSGGSVSEKMRITSGGNVRIGTNSPTEKLSVNGNIRTQKLIGTQLGWSDYVFDKNYKLRSLQNLETYINQNKHLPDVPAAKEVEEKGISVGDNQALLLKKIEELTLYVIDLKKESKRQQEQINELQKRIPR
ncbi:hypothetical protein SAMN05444410_1049 [Hydrobacter penzbergensis]|uniref:Chaperone of endosialidase n=1 Tax=Hydrobacter penzbergensis TaxID=1235997 RepID=A0A8X8LD08_9BACT|nr:hypothetical protein [Hydrobacter penzbergensis]SDW58088.1 hypothetical protein SAMN05444410_1049 [Hydrobacter penzbergensis]